VIYGLRTTMPNKPIQLVLDHVAVGTLNRVISRRVLCFSSTNAARALGTDPTMYVVDARHLLDEKGAIGPRSGCSAGQRRRRLLVVLAVPDRGANLQLAGHAVGPQRKW